MTSNCLYCKNKDCFVLNYFSVDEIDLICNNKAMIFCIKGNRLFNEGEKTDNVYLLYDGCLEVTKKDHKGGDRRIYFAEPGELLGYCSAICGDEHSSTVAVYKNSLVCAIDKSVFLNTFLQNVYSTMSFMRFLSDQIGMREKKIEDLESLF